MRELLRNKLHIGDIGLNRFAVGSGIEGKTGTANAKVY
jgi:hypothetical protein